jgi:hypothetical protein
MLRADLVDQPMPFRDDPETASAALLTPTGSGCTGATSYCHLLPEIFGEVPFKKGEDENW